MLHPQSQKLIFSYDKIVMIETYVLQESMHSIRYSRLPVIQLAHLGSSSSCFSEGIPIILFSQVLFWLRYFTLILWIELMQIHLLGLWTVLDALFARAVCSITSSPPWGGDLFGCRHSMQMSNWKFSQTRQLRRQIQCGSVQRSATKTLEQLVTTDHEYFTAKWRNSLVARLERFSTSDAWLIHAEPPFTKCSSPSNRH